MKIIIILLALMALPYFACNRANSQELTIAIYYLHGEKSKDTHSSTEKIAINNSSVTYSVKYSGRRGKNDIDTNKTCEFTEQDIENIKQTIITKELNVNDSLFSESSKSKSFEVYTNISIAISMDGNEYKIRINGDRLELDDSKLYKNSIFFITMLRKMAKDCK